ncbi:MAG: sigma-70 family RNA polymerase sigma factor [Planctomycetia bacterium]
MTPTPPAPDDALVEAAIRQVRAGDVQAFATIVRRFERPLRDWLVAHAPPAADVDEIAQASFVAAYGRLDDYTAGTCFAAWLFTIARYQLKTETTRLRRIADYHSRYAPDLLARELDRRSEQPMDADDRLAFLRECLEAVDERRRRFLTWRYDEKIPLTEMADRSGRSVMAVKKQLWLLRQQLQQCVEAKAAAARA